MKIGPGTAVNRIVINVNANIPAEFDNGAHGVYCSFRVCVGHMNDLVVLVFRMFFCISTIKYCIDKVFLFCYHIF